MAKLTESGKKSVIKKYYDGAKVSDLAKEYLVDKSTIYNIIKAYKEHGDVSLDDDDQDNTAPETVTDTTADNTDNTDNNVAESGNIYDDAVIEAVTDKADSIIRDMAIHDAEIKRLEGRIDHIREAMREAAAKLAALYRYLNDKGCTQQVEELGRIADMWSGMEIDEDEIGDN